METFNLFCKDQIHRSLNVNLVRNVGTFVIFCFVLAKPLPDRGTADARRSGRRQLWARAVRVRHRGHDERAAVANSHVHLRLSGAGKPGRMASHIKQVCGADKRF